MTALALAACSAPQVKPLDRNPLQSPEGTLELRADVVDGVPMYSLKHGQSDVILPSRLGYDLVGDIDLKDGFKLDDVSYSSFDETWTPVWGEEDHIRNRYNEMLLKLSREDGVRMNIRFRLYNDGLGFRYEFPMENKLTYFKVADELTEFALAGDHTAWWISGDYDTQEYNYYKSRLSQIRGINGADRPYNASQSYIGPTAVQTALQMKTDEGLYINLHEARVLDYSTTSLLLDDKKMVFRTALTPDAQGIKARLQAPCVSPWRTVQVCEKATDVLASRLILNLNDPCVLEDVSWIHPVKYMGVWWEMITGKTHWSYTSDFPSVKLGETDYSKAKPHGRHGANNENVRKYIDFAAANGFDALLIEGWNEGWEDWFGCQKEFVFDFITPYPDFDLPALNEYAHSKGMRLIMHHESSSSTVNYERWMEQAYTLMNQYGYDAVKSGYVGDIIPFGEHHYSQPLITHYHRAVVEAAKHHIMVNAHEAVRPTGLCRTWPNMIGNESAMGNESHLAQHDWQRKRHGQRVSHGHQPRSHLYPAVHALAGRPHGFHARYLRAGYVHHRPRRNRQDAPHHWQSAGPVCHFLQPAADGRGPAGELRPLHGRFPVHQGRGSGLGQEPVPGGGARRVHRHGSSSQALYAQCRPPERHFRRI